MARRKVRPLLTIKAGDRLLISAATDEPIGQELSMYNADLRSSVADDIANVPGKTNSVAILIAAFFVVLFGSVVSLAVCNRIMFLDLEHAKAEIAVTKADIARISASDTYLKEKVTALISEAEWYGGQIAAIRAEAKPPSIADTSKDDLAKLDRDIVRIFGILGKPRYKQ